MRADGSVSVYHPFHGWNLAVRDVFGIDVRIECRRTVAVSATT